MRTPPRIPALTLALAILLLPAGPTARADTDLTPDSVPATERLFRIIVNHRQFDPFLPWQLQPPGMRTGYGVSLGDNLVLTTEHLIRNQTVIELERPRSARKIQARLLFADPMLNLALLRTDSPTAPLRPLPPLPMAPTPGLNTDVHIVQMNDARDVQSALGNVNQIAVTALPDTPYSALAVHLLANINVNGEGAPVFVNDALAGLVFAYQPTTRIATMIAQPFIDRFLENVARPPYRASAIAGLAWTPLADPTQRAYLGLSDNDTGILITRLMPGTHAATLLQPMDVILTWDGFSLDNLGFYEDPEFGRMDFSNLVKGRRAPGEQVPLTVWRDSMQTNLVVTLADSAVDRALVPENVTGERAAYLITGGLLLRELDGFYLRAHGANWMSSADPRMLQFYLAGQPGGHNPGDRIVILAGVLPDRINSGYQDLRGLIITAVNGTPIQSLADAFDIQKRDGQLWRFTAMSMGVDIVLDRTALESADRRIAEDYRIPLLQFRHDTP